jgi:formylglycine-generating enzyme
MGWGSLWKRIEAQRIHGTAGPVFAVGCMAIACGREAPPAPAPPASGASAPQGAQARGAPAAPAGSGIESADSERSLFGATMENDRREPRSRPAGSTAMVWVPGGEFSMGALDSEGRTGPGCGDPTADAQPVHRVYVDGFWMDATEVTNEAFERFVRATGYVTVAERKPTPEEYPDAPRENLVAGSVVFAPPSAPVPLDTQFRWWKYLEGTSWRRPTGTASNVKGRERYPVVQVAYDDAAAHCRWAKKRLPTEAEFEFAARGGLSGRRYAWGDELRPGGRWMANIFQGHFPDKDTGGDGWAGLAPVASFPSNGYGLYDMAGNVWEWVSDWYRPDYYGTLEPQSVARNPTGPADSFDPGEPGVPKRVQRGGSFLCSSQYCTRYLVGSRGKGEPSSGANHLGFRCVASSAR